ncbi:phosphate ABC transporter permease PstA [Plantactinospora sp. KLBMP9567]|uniref:phosphate ABC transporter permease PstA n=1 Tax=Plantactinospora sp. KLBMP9567 TaxID=3085900 RepID=UPI0029817471|nr:phosphate ABC transporter permease PstA [Plantactinospora sp. KLBMP9567]MDW5324449.1 phosphate ABC transporter permease PstA [Plantactinospora sp. KLBMP9567]
MSPKHAIDEQTDAPAAAGPAVPDETGPAAGHEPPRPADPAVPAARVRSERGRTTTLPVRPEQPDAVEVRRITATMRRTDVFAAVGAAVAALSVTTLLYTQLAPFDGVLGFVVIAYLAFLGFYGLLVSLDEDGPAVRDRLVGAVVHSLGFLVLAVLALVVLYTFAEGWPPLTHLNFFTEDMSITGPLEPLSQGGALHAIVGTLQQIALALLFTVPLAVICAVFLSEIPGRLSRLVRTIAEAMTALPSIVAGLFVYATLILALGYRHSSFATSLAISVMMLPIIIRAADVVIRLVPGNLREAALALGASQWRTVWHVVLPTARSGLTTAVILGTARGIGETSPVLLTAGGATSVNLNPFDGWNNSLPLVTYSLTRSPEESFIVRGFGTAATLMMLVLLLFVLARLVGGRGPGQLSRGQLRRRARESARDATRYARRAGYPVAPAPAPRPATAPPAPTGADQHGVHAVSPPEKENRDG